ncbi:MAG TPA: methyltransferase [Acidimicrobiia bacterium]|nr:methyltransferase [Acidimicrobiia bacterium]
MAIGGVSYLLDNTWDNELERLRLLEAVWDPGTTARLAGLGVGGGWRCLELGAGGGSITRWLCDRVGPTGEVTAVDLEPKFVEAEPRPNLDIHRRNIVAHGVPGEGYDLIHTRFLLMHLPDRDRLIADLVSRLRPGGTILLEECDFHPIAAADSTLYAEAWTEAWAAGAATGGDWSCGRVLPTAFVAAGLVDVEAPVESVLFPGASPMATVTAMTWEQMAPVLAARGYPADRLRAAIAELSDPGRWFPSCGKVSASGRRPS